ncbi:MAG: hypothetical protein WA655_15425 [Candidatus Korobacteraceae bacterium]
MRLNRPVVLLMCAVALTPSAIAQLVTANVAVGSNPYAVAANQVTNKIYVANSGDNTVTVIDGATNITATVFAGDFPQAVAVNPVTNKIYVANYGSNNVTVIDGSTNSTAPVGVGSGPVAVAVSPVTNKIYVANSGDNTITVIDGATNGTTTVPAGDYPQAIAVNPVTNKIYVANYNSNAVTVIDGATNATINVATGSGPAAVALNPVTNKIYVSNNLGNSATVIDGATNLTTIVSAGFSPYAVAVNPITNKIYVADLSSNDVTVIDGATNATTSVATGTGPNAAAVNPVTNKIYVANSGSNSVTVIDGATNGTTTLPAGSAPLAIAVNPVTNKTYVPNEFSNSVTEIDGSPFNTATVQVGNAPVSVDVDATSNAIYIANLQDSTVSVINGSTDTVSAIIPVGGSPSAVAVNAVTHNIYVANERSDNVTVIDGITDATTTVPTGSSPFAVAVNPVTNKIYVANYAGNNVTVIDGATNATATVPAGSSPWAVAVNPATNKIYVANQGSNNVTVIDGATNGVTTVPVGAGPQAVAVNPVTNEIYIANTGSNTVTVIDGATNLTTNVAVGLSPPAIGVNAITNRIYVADSGDDTITVIDGATNLTTTLSTGSGPYSVGINSVTNKIYVPNFGNGSNSVTVIDGATNSTATVPAGSGPYAVAVNPVTNKVYVADFNGDDATVINESPRILQGYVAAPQPLSGNIGDALPEFTLNATDGHGNPITPLGVYWQIDTTQGPWSAAQSTGGNSFTAEVTTALTLGAHILYTYPVKGDAGDPTIDMGTPRIGDVSAYLFTVTEQLGQQAGITSPAKGSTLLGNTATFTWTYESGATAYQLWLGHTAGTHDIASIGTTGLAATVTNLPTDGSLIYATLYGYAGNSWSVQDTATYTAATVVAAQITAPTKGSTLSGSLATFTWTAETNGTAYQVWVGSSPGMHDLGSAGSSGLSATVGSLPTDGRPLYVTLYGYAGGWSVQDTATYTAATIVKAQITAPAKGSTLSGNSATFTWTAETGATTYQLWVGSSAGAHDIAVVGTSGLAAAVSNLPTDGRQLYVTLYGYANGWSVQDTATYTAATLAKAQITSPAKGSILSGSSVTFTWTAETGATSYQLWVGNTPGAHDIAVVGSSGLTATVSNLPTDGRQLYVTLYGYAGGTWTVQDTATYTAATIAKAQITAPAKGTTLSGSSVTFTWTAETGATSYQLWVGSSAGAHDIAVVGTAGLAATVNNLPTDGRQLYVTLYGYAGGWSVQDTATYTAASH